MDGRGGKIRGGGFLALQPGFQLVAEKHEFSNSLENPELLASWWNRHWTSLEQLHVDGREVCSLLRAALEIGATNWGVCILAQPIGLEIG